ncbi:MAG: 2Fe-2S iron-sulfur cluster-binding protein [Pseudomonadota bacterium]
MALWRDDKHSGGIKNFIVPRSKSQTIFDVATWVQQNIVPDLSYRFACLEGVCDSCVMMVNSKPR